MLLDTFSTDILVHCCSFLGLIDILSLRRTNVRLRECAKIFILTSKRLFLSELAGTTLVKHHGGSYFLDYDCNPVQLRVNKSKVEQCVKRLLKEITTNSYSDNLETLDLSNLSFRDAPLLYNLRRLVSLDLSGCHKLHPDFLSNTFSKEYNQSLKFLNLMGCGRISGRTICLIARYCPHIETLFLSGCSQTFDDDCLISICHSLPNLISLNISGFDRVTDKGVVSVFQRLTKLQSLDISRCEKIRCSFLKQFGDLIEDWIESHSQEDINHMFRTFMNCDISKAKHLLGMTHQSLVDPFALQLKVAHIAFGSNLSKGLPKNIVTIIALASFGRLEDVVITGSSSVTNEDVINLAKVCGRSLLRLEMACCELLADICLEILGTHAIRLRYLDCSFCPNITDKGIDSLGSIASILFLKIQSLSNITNLCLSSLGRLQHLLLLNVDNCCNLDGDKVLQLCSFLPDLVDLSMKDLSISTKSRSSMGWKERLAFFNGRRTAASDMHSKDRCSIRITSTRNNSNQGVCPRRSYQCRQCSLIPSLNRYLCGRCAERCHYGHKGLAITSMSAYFYCDCTFGCKMNFCQLTFSCE